MEWGEQGVRGVKMRPDGRNIEGSRGLSGEDML